MPSGAKKRKAAKKRKENQSNNASSASTLSHGGDDGKHQEDNSDVGEVSSPTFQDHHSHQNLSTGGKEEEIDKGKNISNLPPVGVKFEDVEDKKIAVQEVNAVPVEREFRIEDDSNKKDGIFKHEATTRKFSNGGSSRSSSTSSSSCSDDESYGAKTSPASEDIAQFMDSVKVADSFGRKAETSNGAIIEEAGESIVENVPVVTKKISLLGEKVEEAISSPAGNSAAPSLVTSVLKETGEKRLGIVEEEVGISTALNAMVEQRQEARVPSVGNITTISDTKECVSQAMDEQLTLSYNAPVTTAENRADREEDSGVTEPLLAPAPRPVHTTSWKSCCGLFEVFTGSGR